MRGRRFRGPPHPGESPAGGSARGRGVVGGRWHPVHRWNRCGRDRACPVSRGPSAGGARRSSFPRGPGAGGAPTLPSHPWTWCGRRRATEGVPAADEGGEAPAAPGPRRTEVREAGPTPSTRGPGAGGTSRGMSTAGLRGRTKPPHVVPRRTGVCRRPTTPCPRAGSPTAVSPPLVRVGGPARLLHGSPETHSPSPRKCPSVRASAATYVPRSLIPPALPVP